MNSQKTIVLLLVMLPIASFAQFRKSVRAESIQLTELSGNFRIDLQAGLDRTWNDSIMSVVVTREDSKKSPLRAALFSAVIPGSGEFYTDSYWRAGVFFAAEVGLWIAYAAYTSKGNDQTDLFQNFADEHWSVVRYAQWIEQYAGQLNPDAGGCSGMVTGGGGLPPWERVDWSKLNLCEEVMGRKSGNGFTHRLPQRPEQQYYELIGKYPQYAGGWDDATTVTPSDIVQKKVSPRFLEYSEMRGKANDFYNIAGTAASVLVVNHVLSALDAAWSAAQFNNRLKLETRLKPAPRPYGFTELVPTASMTIRF